MRAIHFDRFGEPAEVLSVVDRPEPVAAPGEVRVRLRVSPVNPSDLAFIDGNYPVRASLPATPGFEGMGVVESANAGLLGRLLLGRRVALLSGNAGMWRELTTVPAKQVIPLPGSIDDEQGSMLFVNPTTSYAMVRRVLAVPAGSWLLQTAAGSAVGRMVIRLGKHFAFHTLNVVRRPEQVDPLRLLGADHVVVADANTLESQVRERLPDGVPFAIDPIGGELGSAVVRCLGSRGRLLVYGALSGKDLELSPRSLMTPLARIEGFWLGRYLASLGLVAKLQLFARVIRLVRSGVLDSEVSLRYGLDSIADAVRSAREPARAGKVLLRL